MAIVRIPDENRSITETAEIEQYLSGIGIDYERWAALPSVADGSSAEQILQLYSSQIDVLKKRGGYVTADVIDVQPHTPNLEQMLAKFSREHWHNEDEVRFIVEGRGIFHIHSRLAGEQSYAPVGTENRDSPLPRLHRGGETPKLKHVPTSVVAIEVEAGDMIRVPAGTWHWFDLCADRRIRAIRLFQDPGGWTPHYTDSGIDEGYQPLCLGPTYLPGASA